MGVKGLLEILKPLTARQHLSVFRGTILAIDASTWLHWAATSCAIELALGFPTQIYIETLKSRLIRLLDSGIIPIFIFDGAPLPSKGVTTTKRSGVAQDVAMKGFNYLLDATRSIEEKKLREQHQDNNNIHHLDPSISSHSGTSGDLAARLAAAQGLSSSAHEQRREATSTTTHTNHSWEMNIDKLSHFHPNRHHAYGPNSAHLSGNPDLYLSLAIDKFKQVANRSTYQTISFQSLLTSFNVMWIQAPYEADAQIGYLYQKGLVQGVLGEDSDYFLFGCGLVLLKMDQQSMVDVIDLRAGVIQNIMDSYEQAKARYAIYLNEVKMVQYANDPRLIRTMKETIQNDPFLRLNFGDDINLPINTYNNDCNLNNQINMDGLDDTIHSLHHDDLGTFPQTILHQLDDGPIIFPTKKQNAPNLTLSQYNFNDLYEFYHYYNQKDGSSPDCVQVLPFSSPPLAQTSTSSSHHFDPGFTQSLLISTILGDYNSTLLNDGVSEPRNGKVLVNAVRRDHTISQVDSTFGKMTLMQRFIHRHYKPTTKSLTQLRGARTKTKRITGPRPGKRDLSEVHSNMTDDDDADNDQHHISTQLLRDNTYSISSKPTPSNPNRRNRQTTPIKLLEEFSSQEFEMDFKSAKPPVKKGLCLDSSFSSSYLSLSDESEDGHNPSRNGLKRRTGGNEDGINVFAFMQHKRNEKSSLERAKLIEKQLILAEKQEMRAEKELQKARKLCQKEKALEVKARKKVEKQPAGAEKTTRDGKAVSTTGYNTKDSEISDNGLSDEDDDDHNDDDDDDDALFSNSSSDFGHDLFDSEDFSSNTSTTTSTTTSTSDDDCWEPSWGQSKDNHSRKSEALLKSGNKVFLTTCSSADDDVPMMTDLKPLTPLTTKSNKSMATNPSPATKRKAEWVLGDDSDSDDEFSTLSGLEMNSTLSLKKTQGTMSTDNDSIFRDVVTAIKASPRQGKTTSKIQKTNNSTPIVSTTPTKRTKKGDDKVGQDGNKDVDTAEKSSAKKKELLSHMFGKSGITFPFGTQNDPFAATQFDPFATQVPFDRAQSEEAAPNTSRSLKKPTSISRPGHSTTPITLDPLSQLYDDSNHERSPIDLISSHSTKTGQNNEARVSFKFTANSLDALSSSVVYDNFGQFSGKGIYRPPIGPTPLSLRSSSFCPTLRNDIVTFPAPNYDLMSAIHNDALVMLSDQDYIDQRFKRMEFLNSLPASKPLFSTQAPLPSLASPQITNNLTTSLQLQRLGALITPHQHTLRKDIASSPFLFLGPRSHITSSHPQSILSNLNSNPVSQPDIIKTSSTSITVKDALQWGYVLKLIALSHFQFVEVCVLAGCDYLPSLHGLGFKKALTLYSLTGSAHNVVDLYYQQCLASLRRDEKKSLKLARTANAGRATKKEPTLSTKSTFNYGYSKDEDEFGAGLYDEIEWSDDDDREVEDHEAQPENKTPTKKRRPWSNEAELYLYFQQYHDNYDFALLSYLYQYVIDPVRERFSHVFNLLDLQSILPSTLTAMHPVSASGQDHFHSKQTGSNNGGTCLSQLPCREQQSLLPILSFVSSQTSSTDDLVGFWSHLKAKRMRINAQNFSLLNSSSKLPQFPLKEELNLDHTKTTPIVNQSENSDQPIPSLAEDTHSVSRQLQDYLLQHVDREYVVFTPKVPYFILQSNITTAFPIVLNYEPIHFKKDGDGVGMRPIKTAHHHNNPPNLDTNSNNQHAIGKIDYITEHTPLIDPREPSSLFYRHQLEQTSVSLIVVQPDSPLRSGHSYLKTDVELDPVPKIKLNKDKFHRHLLGQYLYWVSNNPSPVPPWQSKQKRSQESLDSKENDETLEKDDTFFDLDGLGAEKMNKDSTKPPDSNVSSTSNPHEININRETLLSYLNQYVYYPDRSGDKVHDTSFVSNETHIERISKVNNSFQNYQRKLLHFLTVQQRNNIIPKDLLHYSFNLMDRIGNGQDYSHDEDDRPSSHLSSASNTPIKSQPHPLLNLNLHNLDDTILRDQIQTKINLYTEKMECIGYTLPHNLARGVLYGELDPYWLTYTNPKFAFPHNCNNIFNHYYNGSRVVLNYPYLGPNFGLHCALTQHEKDEMLKSRNLFCWSNIINSMLESFNQRNDRIHKILGIKASGVGTHSTLSITKIPQHLTISHFNPSSTPSSSTDPQQHSSMSSVSHRLHFHLLKLFTQISAPLPFSLDTPITVSSEKLNRYQTLNSLSNLQSLWLHQGGYVKSLHQHIVRSVLQLPVINHHDLVSTSVPIYSHHQQDDVKYSLIADVHNKEGNKTEIVGPVAHELDWVSCPVPFQHHYKLTQSSDFGALPGAVSSHPDLKFNPLRVENGDFSSSQSFQTPQKITHSHLPVQDTSSFDFPDDILTWLKDIDRDVVFKLTIIAYTHDIDLLNLYYQKLQTLLYNIDALDNQTSFNVGGDDDSDLNSNLILLKNGANEIFQACTDRIKVVRGRQHDQFAVTQSIRKLNLKAHTPILGPPSTPFRHNNSPFAQIKSPYRDAISWMGSAVKEPIRGVVKSSRVQMYLDKLILREQNLMPARSLNTCHDCNFSSSTPTEGEFGHDEVIRLDQYVTKDTISYLSFHFLIASAVNPTIPMNSHPTINTNSHFEHPTRMNTVQNFDGSDGNNPSHLLDQYKDALSKLASVVGYGLDSYPHLLALLNVLRFSIPVVHPHSTTSAPITLSIFGLYATMSSMRLPLGTNGLLSVRPSFEKQMVLTMQQNLLQSSIDSDQNLLSRLTNPNQFNSTRRGTDVIKNPDQLRDGLLLKRKTLAILKQRSIQSKENLHSYILSPESCLTSHRNHYKLLQEYNGVDVNQLKCDNGITKVLMEQIDDFRKFQKSNPDLICTQTLSLPLTSLLLHYKTNTPAEIIPSLPENNEPTSTADLITSPHVLSGEGTGRFFTNSILTTHPSHLNNQQSMYQPRSEGDVVSLGISPLYLLFMLSSIYSQALVSFNIQPTIPANLLPITTTSFSSLNPSSSFQGDSGYGGFGSSSGSNNNNSNNNSFGAMHLMQNHPITHNPHSLIPSQTILQLLFPIIPVYTYSAGATGGMSAIFHKMTSHSHKLSTMVKEMITAHGNTLVHRIKLFQTAFTLGAIAMSRDYHQKRIQLENLTKREVIKTMMGDDDGDEYHDQITNNFHPLSFTSRNAIVQGEPRWSLFGPGEMQHFNPKEPLSIRSITTEITQSTQYLRKTQPNSTRRDFEIFGQDFEDVFVDHRAKSTPPVSNSLQSLATQDHLYQNNTSYGLDPNDVSLDQYGGDFELDEDGFIIQDPASMYQTTSIPTASTTTLSTPVTQSNNNQPQTALQSAQMFNLGLSSNQTKSTRNLQDVVAHGALDDMFADLLDDINSLKQMDYRSFLIDQDDKKREDETTRQLHHQQAKVSKMIAKEQRKTDRDNEREARKQQELDSFKVNKTQAFDDLLLDVDGSLPSSLIESNPSRQSKTPNKDRFGSGLNKDHDATNDTGTALAESESNRSYKTQNDSRRKKSNQKEHRKRETEEEQKRQRAKELIQTRYHQFDYSDDDSGNTPLATGTTPRKGDQNTASTPTTATQMLSSSGTPNPFRAAQGGKNTANSSTTPKKSGSLLSALKGSSSANTYSTPSTDPTQSITNTPTKTPPQYKPRPKFQSQPQQLHIIHNAFDLLSHSSKHGHLNDSNKKDNELTANLNRPAVIQSLALSNQDRTLTNAQLRYAAKQRELGNPFYGGSSIPLKKKKDNSGSE